MIYTKSRKNGRIGQKSGVQNFFEESYQKSCPAQVAIIVGSG
jgi:hypothetical protein